MSRAATSSGNDDQVGSATTRPSQARSRIPERDRSDRCCVQIQPAEIHEKACCTGSSPCRCRLRRQRGQPEPSGITIRATRVSTGTMVGTIIKRCRRPSSGSRSARIVETPCHEKTSSGLPMRFIVLRYRSPYASASQRKRRRYEQRRTYIIIVGIETASTTASTLAPTRELVSACPSPDHERWCNGKGARACRSRNGQLLRLRSRR
jgi:hypothetical protein